ncbi:hypothetical protein ACNEP6_25635 [Escherichia coli]
MQLEGQKRSQKRLIDSLKNRPFYHLLHRKGASSGRNVTPCRCGQKNCLRRAKFQLVVAQRAAKGHPAGHPVAIRERILGLERGSCLASGELVDLQGTSACNLRDKNAATRNPVLGMGDVFSVLYLLDVGVMNVPVP